MKIRLKYACKVPYLLCKTVKKTELLSSQDPNPKKMKTLINRFLLIAFFSIAAIAAQSQTNTWDGSSSNNWNTAANWSLNVVPTSAHDVVIPDNFNVTVNTAAVCKSFTINGGGNSNTVTISAGQSLTVTGAVTIGAGTGSGDNKTLAVGSSSLSCASVTISATGNANRTSAITLSTGTITVTGNITLGDANDDITFSGAGLLKVGGNMSGGTFTASTGTVEYYGNGSGGTSSNQTIAAYAYNNLTVSGNGTKTLSGNTTVGATVTIDAGVTLGLSTYTLGSPTSLVMETGGTSGSAISGSGTLTLGGNVTVNNAGTGNGATISAPLALGSTRTFTVANDGTTAVDLTISSIISGSAGITKDGAGTMDLSAANTYTGNTIITLGILRASSNVIASTNGAFGNSASANGNISLNGGTLQSNTATFSKTITVTTTNSGLDAFGASRTISGTINRNVAGTANLNIGGITSANAEGQDLTLSGTISNSTGTLNITKVGTSTVTVSGSNSFSGTTIISGGTLIAGNNVPSGSNGALGNAASAITLGDAATTTNNYSPSFLIGGAFTVARSITVANQGTSGVYSIGGNSSNTSVFSGTITLNEPLTISQTTGGTVQLSGTVTANSNKLTKAGAGTFQRTTATLTLTGDFEIAAGTYDANARATTVTGVTTVSGGTYTAGSAAQTFNGGIEVSGGTYNGLSGTAGNTSATSVTISSGTFSAPGSTGTFTVSDNWNRSGGTFTHNNGTVSFNGTNQSVSGNTTFFNFSKTVASAATLTFASGSTQVFSGTLTLSGTSGNLLTLAPGTAGVLWTINPSASSVNYVSVSYSTNSNASAINAANSFNGGNNVNWSFPAGTPVKLAITPNITSPQTAGGNFSVTVQAQDVNGTPANVTSATGISLSASGTGSLSGNTGTIANGSNSVTLSGVSYTKAETVTFTAARTSGMSLTTSAASNSVVFNAGALSGFVVEAAGGGNIGTQSANNSFAVRITAVDNNGNTVTSFNGAGNTVTFSSAGVITAGTVSTAFASGVLSSHSITIGDAGTFTLTATRTSGGVQSGTSNSFTVNPGAKTSTGSTDWNLASTWSPSGVPNAGDAVVIRAGDIVTVSSSPTSSVYSITFGNTSSSVSGLVFSNNAVLTVDGSITLQNDDNTNISTSLSGAGTLNCATLTVGGTTTTLSSDQTTVFTSGISNLNITGNLSIFGEDDGADDNDASFILVSGTVTVGGSIYTDEENGSACTFNMNSGAETGTLILTGATPFTDAVGSLSFDASGSGATVVYSGSLQTVRGVAYTNLTLSGSGTKTTTGVTVNGTLTLEGTAVVSVAPTYGTSASLRYNSSTARNAGAEWINTFTATGGVTISNTGTVSLNANKQLGNNTNVPLTIENGATLSTSASNFSITFHGDFSNSGTFTAGNSNIILAGTVSSQSIDGLSTGGTLSLTKTSGTATLQGNVNAAALTINGNGGTLNLGSGYTHTITGTWTRTAGTLNGGSSTLRLGAGFSGTGGTFASGTGTIDWNANGNQTIAAVTYYNLSLSGSGTKTLTGVSSVSNDFTLNGTVTTTAALALTVGGNIQIASGATFNAGAFTHNIGGDWQNSGTFNAGTSTINFNGTTHSITGSSTFNQLSLANNGTVTFGAAQTVNSLLSIASGSLLNLGTFTSSANTLSLNGIEKASGSWGSTASSATFKDNTFFAGSGTINIASCTSGLWTGALSNDWFNAGNWCGGVPTSSTNVTISADGIQPQINSSGAVCNNLTLSTGSVLTLGSAGSISVFGTFTNSGSLSANSASTFNYAKTSGTQNIIAANYGGLTLSGGGTKSFPAGTIGISGAFTPGTFTSASQGTIEFNGTGSQTIPAFGYYNLVSSNTGARTLASSGTISITGSFTPGLNSYTVTGSTISFNGAVQTIPSFTYNHLRRDGTGTNVATFSGNSTIQGNLTIATGGIAFNNSAVVQTITVNGNYVQSGSATADFGPTGTTASSILEVAGDITVSGTGSITTTELVPNGTIVLKGTNEQNVAISITAANMSYVNFTVNNGAIMKLGAGLALSKANGSQYRGTLSVSNGGALNASTYTISGQGTGSQNAILTLNPGASFITANTNGVTGTAASVNTTNLDAGLNTGADYTFNGTSVQVTTGLPATVRNLIIQNAAGVTLSANLTMNGTLTLGSGTFNIVGRTFVLQNSDIPVERDGVTTTGTLATNNTTNLQFGSAGNKGGVSFTLPNNMFSSTPAAIGTLTVNRDNPISLSSQDITIGTSLVLTSGTLSAGSNTITVANGGTVNRTSGHVSGNLKKFISNGTNPSVVFEVGDLTNYAPVTINITGNVTASTGSFTIRSTQNDHPTLGTSGINESKSVNRYWTINNTSVPGMSTYNAVFSYNGTDNDPSTNAANYAVRKYNGSSWSLTTLSGTPSSTSATVTGLNGTGLTEFAIGESTGTITVTTQPVASSVCNGSNTSFTAGSTSTPTPSVQWQRDNNSGFQNIDATTDGGIYSGFNTTTLSVTGATTAQNGYLYRAVFTNINGSAESDAAALTVTAYVTPAVNIVLSTGSNPSCEGSSVTITANASNAGGGVVTYQFLKNGSPVQTGTNNQLVTSSFTSGDEFSCTISVSGGICLNTTSANSNFISLFRNPILTPTVSLTVPDAVVCGGSTVEFTATAGNTGGGTVTYQFLKNGSEVQSGNSNKLITSVLADGDQISCVITVDNGTCLSTPTATSNSITLTVINPNITPTVSLAASTSTTVCAGSAVTFTATAGNTQGGSVTYTFKVNGGIVQSGSGNTYTINSITNGTKVICEIGVGGGSCVTTTTASNEITMSTLPGITVSLSRNPVGDICSGSTVTFTAAAGNSFGGTVAYTFKVNGSNVQSGNSATYSASSFSNGDIVTCDVVLTGGTCGGSSASSNSIILPVTSTLTPSVTLAVTPGATLCPGATATFTASSSNVSGGSVSYNFKINGVSAQTGSSNSFIRNNLSNGDVVSCTITVNGLACGTPIANSNNITMNIPVSGYVWTGAVSNVWGNANNWNVACGAPPAGSDVIIPTGATRYPLISSGTVTVGNITIQSGASVTVNGSGLIQIGGTITNSGILNLLSGAVEFNGSAVQTVNGDSFIGSTVQNLRISNNVTLSGTLNVTGVVSFGNVNSKTFNSAGYLILKSIYSGTASVADITNSNTSFGNTITGNVTVERYIPASRKWRALSAPLKGSVNNSIFDNWQNGGVETAYTGVLLWSPSGTGADGNGLSLNSNPGASQNILGYSVNSFTTPSNTKTTPLFTANGPVPYIVFVTDYYKRNSANGNVSSGIGATATTLKATGNLVTGAYAVTNLAAGYRMIANPYASPIDFATVGKTNINNQFWVWDPKLNGNSGYGGYVYTSNSGGGYVSAPTGGSYANSSTIIQSGSAFWVKVNDGFVGALSFQETDKANGGYNVFGRLNGGLNEILRVNLTNPAGDQVMDGVAAAYHQNSSVNLESSDVVKFSLGVENISMRRFAKDLAIEFRPLIDSRDTIYIRLHNMQQKQYSLMISGENFKPSANITAILQDLYLNNETPINIYGQQMIPFTVTGDAASTGDRFRIVFRPSAVTPVTDIQNQKGFRIYPNPVAKGMDMQFELKNMVAGKYQVTITDIKGARITSYSIQHGGGNATHSMKLPSVITAGTYIAEIRNQKGETEQVKLTVQ